MAITNVTTLYDSLRAVQFSASALAELRDLMCDEDRAYNMITILVDRLLDDIVPLQREIYSAMSLIEPLPDPGTTAV